MLRLNQLKLKPDHSQADMDKAIHKALRLGKSDLCQYKIFKRSIDARHKPDIMYIYSVDIISVTSGGNILSDNQIIKLSRNKNLIETKEYIYKFPYVSDNDIEQPVIIGFGPAGMFAALELARAGYKPVVFERGQNVEKRKRIVEQFWNGGKLDTDTNVQFGEGGAGTFSDGKLNTMIKDPSGRIRKTLYTFVEFGADPSILYINKPHIGTDILSDVVKNIREEIIRLGGEVNFGYRLDDIVIKDNRVNGIKLTEISSGKYVDYSCKHLCLALGHSARDTFAMLDRKNLIMEAKPFAVGLRLEHTQSFIDYNAYGNAEYKLPAADYKVTYQTAGGRGVYSFCMCPGGYVVNASSEPERIAVNGMSYSGRDGNNSNSAIIVTVTPDDFGHGVMDGIEFQRNLEGLAYRYGNTNIPVQLLADFKNNKVSSGFGCVTPSIKGSYSFANLRDVLPDYVAESIAEGVTGFAKHIHGFDMEDAVFSGVESRTSSPVRIVRGETLESNTKGIYPCGEGAGYAGGITSAAVDGIKVAESIARNINQA